MNSNENMIITTKREYLVVKGNELVQQNRFELSLPEQKTIAYICSMIKPIEAIDKAKGVPYQLEYEFSIREYCKVCGIDYDNGKNYANVKAILKSLYSKAMWIKTPNGSDTIVSWLRDVTINPKSGMTKVLIDYRLAPYLFDLGQNFTQYQLYNILAMKSAFSVRIYELVKSYAFQETKIFDVDELKHLLMVDDKKSYKDFSLFRIKVLEKAQEEINELTDMNICFEPITEGRKVVKIKFHIKQKNQMERFIASTTVNDRLEKLNNHNEKQ